MKKLCYLSLFLALIAPLPVIASSVGAGIRLWRLDCGSLWTKNLNDLSDTYAYTGKSKLFVGSCYLIQHGADYLLWDTGLSKENLNKPLIQGDTDSMSLKTTVVDQLAALKIGPEQISLVGISHYHLDHIGQAAEFPRAKLLIGLKDFNVLRDPDHEARAEFFSPWLRDGGKVEKITGDYDVFGDGSVYMLHLPGHTPGHYGLLVHLPKRGPVLLSGDVVHFRENLDSMGIPSFNTDRAQSLASIGRFKELARNLKATIIIQHEQGDVGKLPTFPIPAE